MSFSDLFNLNTYDGDMFIYGENKDSIYGIKNECLEPNMDIVIPDGTKTLSFSFVQKINAKSIYIPSSVERIGLLSSLKSVDNIIIDNNNQFYGSYDSNVIVNKKTMTLIYVAKNFRIPEGIKIIGKNCFNNNNDITSIIIPDGVEIIGDSAFSECKNLENITFPNTLTIIERHSFSHCKKLKDFILPNSLKRIEEYAFNECMSIKNLVIPDSCEFIGGVAFENCFSLENIVLPANLKVDYKIVYYGIGVEDPFGDNPTDHEYKLKGNIYKDGMYIGSKTNPYYMMLTCESNGNTLIIHEDTKIISSDVFLNALKVTSKIRKIIIPKNISIILYKSLSHYKNDCTIEYTGTVEEWNKIDIKFINGSEPGENIININCIDGITELEI